MPQGYENPRSTAGAWPSGAGRSTRRRIHVRPSAVLLLALAGWFAWASTTPGGASARVNSVIDRIRTVLDDATTDPGLKRAATYYNDWHAREGTYPKLSEEQMRDDPTAGWGVGVNVDWCGPHAIVLRSLTGNGTISRLLLNGVDLGDVTGTPGCPADLTNPEPWVTASR
jgi:hypothetical protein